MKNGNYRILISVVLTISFIGVAFTQSDLLKKPFKQWSKGDVEKILTDSAWAQTQEVRNFNFGANIEDTKFTARLRSGVPIRQAFLRLKQLDAKYDYLSDAEKAVFDAKNKGILECPACGENYVVTLTSKSQSSPEWDWVFKAFGYATTESLQKYVTLANEKGEQRRLIHFTSPKAVHTEAMFFFPRFDQTGKPLVTAENKKIRFQIATNEGNLSKNFEFDVSKLIINGEVAF